MNKNIVNVDFDKEKVLSEVDKILAVYKAKGKSALESHFRYIEHTQKLTYLEYKFLQLVTSSLTNGVGPKAIKSLYELNELDFMNLGTEDTPKNTLKRFWCFCINSLYLSTFKEEVEYFLENPLDCIDLKSFSFCCYALSEFGIVDMVALLENYLIEYLKSCTMGFENFDEKEKLWLLNGWKLYFNENENFSSFANQLFSNCA